MQTIKTGLPGLIIIKPKVFEDNRGYFFESFNKNRYADQALEHDFVQDNESLSTFGIIRGLHYQLAPYAQTKLMRVIYGKIYDVAVDLRENAPTFGQWYGKELSSENKEQLLIPRGFAHGFSVLSDKAIVFYKCDNYYQPESERGINYKDPGLNIDWKVDPEQAIVSAKDKVLPDFKEAEMNFSI